MGFFDLIDIWTNYGGVIIGFGIVIVATFLLPAKIRWYVFTAGMGILIFRTWQIYSTGKKFEAWDKKDGELREAFKGLKKEGKVLVTQLNEQRKQLDSIKTEKVQLEQEAASLKDDSAELAVERQQRAKKIKKLNANSVALNQRVDTMLKAHTAVEKAEKLLAQRQQIKATELSDADLMGTF